MLENKGVFTCSCGCGSAMTVSYINKTAYLDFLSSDYFTKQGLLTNLKETMALAAAEAISPKPIILKEILIDRDTLIHLKKSLQSLELSNEQNHNNSKLKVSYDDLTGYSLLLISDMSLMDILKKIRHRAFEISIGQKERREILRQINRALAIPQRKDDANDSGN